MACNMDLVVLGGGCAGLSLAVALAKLDRPASRIPKVMVLEKRTRYVHDRTWCFFMDPTAPLQHRVQQQWQTMRVTTQQHSVTLDCGATPYLMLPSGLFYEDAQNVISQSDRTALHTGTTVTSEPEKRGDLWCVETSAGLVQTRYVVDTRPVCRPTRGGAVMWQSFYGQEVECEEGVFNAACGELMDFSAAQACGALVAFPDAVCFVYLLASSGTRALIEFTVFGPDPLGPDAFRQVQARAVAQRVGNAAFKVLHTEHGVLPMGASPMPPGRDTSYVRAGLMAGGARPSTGYAFARIQRWATACADALASGQAPTGHAPDSWAQHTMDALFLNVVRAHPQLAPDLFMALFEGVDTKRMIRFLSDHGTMLDYAAVVAALPPWPFLRELTQPLAKKFQRSAAASKNGPT